MQSLKLLRKKLEKGYYIHLLADLKKNVIHARRKRYKLCCTLILLTNSIRDVILLLYINIEIDLDCYEK